MYALTHKRRDNALLFLSASFMFVRLCSSFVIFSNGFVICALPHKHRVCSVIFSLGSLKFARFIFLCAVKEASSP